jgi:hypothetical protein
MVKNAWLISLVFVMIISSVGLIPVYAEVTSLQSDQSFYTSGNKIYFTGTVGIDDYQKLVNLVIHDPTGKFVLISGNYSDSTYTFEVVVDTNNTDQFYTKGTYQAVAFVGKESEGKISNFDFSPDGSPVIHHVSSTNATNSSPAQPSPQHYQAQLNENVGIKESTGNLTTTSSSPPISAEKSPGQYDFKNILYPVISLCGVGIVAIILYGRKRNKQTRQKLETQLPSSSASTSEPGDDYALMILKNRLAKGELTLEEFKTIKDVLSES